MKYLIKGNTYQFRKDFVALGCKWLPEKKAWETPHIEKDGHRFKKIESVVSACCAEMIPISNLSDQEKTIQGILGNL